MTNQESWLRIASAVDVNKVIRWALELAEIYSPTGSENAVAEYLHGEYRKIGLHSKLQPVAPQRCNAIARLQGTGGGYSLMLNCHLDTFLLGNPQRRFHFAKRGGKDGVTDRPIKALQIDEHWLTGQEIGNMKCAMAAYLGAIDAIIRSELDLKGDIILAGVVGADPTPAWAESTSNDQGDQIGVGTKFMLNNGIYADMCILGEPTSLGVALAPFGRVRLKVTSIGTGIDQFELTSEIVSAFESWRSEYGKAHTFHNLQPSLSIAGVHFQPASSESSVYLELRTTPHQNSLAAVDEVREVLSRLQKHNSPVETIVEPLMIEPSTVVAPDQPVVRSLFQAHTRVCGTQPQILYVPWSGDANRLNQSGIPTVIYGPGWNIGSKGYKGDTSYNAMNYQNIDDLVSATRVYSLMMADIATRSRAGTRHPDAD